jgi:tetratricopeptide (TPR) repeat protein
MGPESTLFVEADNNAFPVAYSRIVERERPDVAVYDRFNIIFKIPYVGEVRKPFVGNWKEYRNFLEQNIVERAPPASVYYSIFEPASVTLPEGYSLVPYGVLYQVRKGKGASHPFKIENVFRYYATESFYDDFERDFHSREISAHFFYRYGLFVFMTGNRELGLRYMRKASRIGYDDTAIHAAIGTFLTQEGMFDEARRELEKMSRYYDDLSIVHNNWGYFYHKKGDFDKAIQRFRKAIAEKPKRVAYYNNLGYSLYEAGKRAEALKTFETSLKIRKGQKDIERFIEENLQGQDDR